MGERARIARFFAPLAAGEHGSFNLTDDAAIITPPLAQQLVITTDSVIETIHVLAGATPEQFAQKLMRRNLSDLAAMGATPWRYMLNLHTPSGLHDTWLSEFCAALSREQNEFGLVLVGGDSTSGATHIHTTMTCMGLIDGTPLRRNGAQMGDDIYVSGSLGGAAFALSLLQQKHAITQRLAGRYHCPEPRLTLGNALRGIATSCIDISDGLLADMGQITAASHVGATLHRHALPVDSELAATLASDDAAWRFALSGGDDYELLFTASPRARDTMQALAETLALPLTHIGEITATQGIKLVDAQGVMLPITHEGWEHA